MSILIKEVDAVNQYSILTCFFRSHPSFIKVTQLALVVFLALSVFPVFMDVINVAHKSIKLADMRNPKEVDMLPIYPDTMGAIIAIVEVSDFLCLIKTGARLGEVISGSIEF